MQSYLIRNPFWKCLGVHRALVSVTTYFEGEWLTLPIEWPMVGRHFWRQCQAQRSISTAPKTTTLLPFGKLPRSAPGQTHPGSNLCVSVQIERERNIYIECYNRCIYGYRYGYRYNTYHLPIFSYLCPIFTTKINTSFRPPQSDVPWQIGRKTARYFEQLPEEDALLPGGWEALPTSEPTSPQIQVIEMLNECWMNLGELWNCVEFLKLTFWYHIQMLEAWMEIT